MRHFLAGARKTYFDYTMRTYRPYQLLVSFINSGKMATTHFRGAESLRFPLHGLASSPAGERESSSPGDTPSQVLGIFLPGLPI